MEDLDGHRWAGLQWKPDVFIIIFALGLKNYGLLPVSLF